MEIASEQLTQELEKYTGSTQFYEFGMYDYKLYLTEGVKYLAEIAGAFWLLDVIYSWQYKSEVSKEPFQVWELVRVSGNSFVVTCEDGNKRKLARQGIPFSDFPLDKITIWFINRNTLMLPSEY